MSRLLYGIAGLLLAAALLAPVEGAEAAQGAEIRLSPRSVNFGQVAGSRSRTVKIQNRGDADLVVSSIAACAGTSAEFAFSAPPGPIPPRKSGSLQVTYTPVDAGSDAGCLLIDSNDAASPTAQLDVRGAARAGGGGSGGGNPANPLLRWRPRGLDFGTVEVGTTATLAVSVQTRGGVAQPAVVVNRCFTPPTSDEFTFEPLTEFAVAPGRGAEVLVSYSPTDLGADAGCLEARTGAADEVPAVLDLAGEGIAPLTVDLDIADFKVKKEARLKQGQRVHLRLWVFNPGPDDAPRTATVVGEQNGVVVYEESQPVSDKPGDSGLTPYRFPRFTPQDPGDVLWTATIDDDDPDVDESLAVTRVIDGAAGTGVDLDIRRFRATARVDLGEEIRVRLWVENRGTVDDTRTATLTGTIDGAPFYSEMVTVSDPVGNRGATRFDFSPVVADTAGEILWQVVVDDDDPDVDEAFAVTRVDS